MNITPPKSYALGDSVTHTGSIGGMKTPTGRITRLGRLNSLLSVVTYGVTFPHGYFLVPEDQLVARCETQYEETIPLRVANEGDGG